MSSTQALGHNYVKAHSMERLALATADTAKAALVLLIVIELPTSTPWEADHLNWHW
jgi:hypothetical protein